MFPHQYLTIVFTQNSISQTFVVLNVKTIIENKKNMLFETQQNYKLLIVSIFIYNNCLSFFMCKNKSPKIPQPSKLHPKFFPPKVI